MELTVQDPFDSGASEKVNLDSDPASATAKTMNLSLDHQNLGPINYNPGLESADGVFWRPKMFLQFCPTPTNFCKISSISAAKFIPSPKIHPRFSFLSLFLFPPRCERVRTYVMVATTKLV